MNFQILKYFRVVAEELNITHASQRLYISQQALSAHVKNLENELDVSLFSRTPRLSLTDAGKCLYEATKEIEEINSSLNDKLNDIRKEVRGELRIGISFTRGQFILPYILPEYSKQNPGVHINIFEESSQNLYERLLKGELDFWITAENPQVEGLVVEPLFSEKFYLVLPFKLLERTYGNQKAQEIWEKTKTNSFDVEEIIDCPFVLLNPRNRTRDLFDEVVRSRHLVPNIILETDNAQTGFALSLKEMAVTVYSEMFLKNYEGKIKSDIALIPFDKYIKPDILNIIYTNGKVSGYRKSFLKEIHKTFC